MRSCPLTFRSRVDERRALGEDARDVRLERRERREIRLEVAALGAHVGLVERVEILERGRCRRGGSTGARPRRSTRPSSGRGGCRTSATMRARSSFEKREARGDRLGDLGADAVVVVERVVLRLVATRRACAACRRRAAAPRCGGPGSAAHASMHSMPWRQTSYACHLFCSMPTPSSSSGHVTPRMPVRRITSNAREGRRAFIVLTHSSRTRSAATLRYVSSVGAMARLGRRIERELERRDEARRAQHAQPVLARSARAGRRRRAAGPAPRSPRPSNGSMSLPSSGVDRDGVDREVAPREIGRDVVDELDRSRAGARRCRRPRRAASSPRSGAPSFTTVTVPCSMPVGMARGKIVSSSFGRASVADVPVGDASRPSRRSRTQPPTIHARLPLRAEALAEVEHVAGDDGEVDGVGGHRLAQLPRACCSGHGRGIFRVRNISAEGDGDARLQRGAQARTEAIRAWCTDHLGAEGAAALEAGEVLPYPLMRELCATFGVPDMVRAQFAKMQARAGSGDGEKRAGLAAPSEGAARWPILMMELSRFCPGFALAFGASLGLCGGAIMSRGTLEQKERFALPVLHDGEDRRLGAHRAGRRERRLRVDEDARAQGRRRLARSPARRRSSPTPPYADVVRRLRADARRRRTCARSSSSAAPRAARRAQPFKKMGMHTSPTGEVFLDDVFVPADQLARAARTGERRARRRSRRSRASGSG